MNLLCAAVGRALAKKCPNNQKRRQNACTGQADHFNFCHFALALPIGESEGIITPYGGRIMAIGGF